MFDWKAANEDVPRVREVVLVCDVIEDIVVRSKQIKREVYRLLCYYGFNDWRDEMSGDKDYVPQWWCSIVSPEKSAKGRKVLGEFFEAIVEKLEDLGYGYKE